MNSYTMDANILIGLERNYPREIFGSLWMNIEGLIAQGRCCICPMVVAEVARGHDDLSSWAKSVSGFVHEHTAEEFETVTAITTDHPNWVRDQKNAADPFVISHAKFESSLIVSNERRKGTGVMDHNLTIPNVADEHGVKCIDFFELLRVENWRF